jgi:DNA-directed RNA polymerase sigma subunit (sigma70/sigma32)
MLARSTGRDPLSLESPLSEDGAALGDFVPDAAARSRFDSAAAALRRVDTASALAMLPECDRRIIELRYPADGGRPATLDEIGRDFALSRERIRQMEQGALRKLAALPESERLQETAG